MEHRQTNGRRLDSMQKSAELLLSVFDALEGLGRVMLH